MQPVSSFFAAGLFAAISLFLPGHQAAAQTSSNITTSKIVFPFAAGGSGDALARLIGDRIQPLLKRSIVVENRTGGSGMIGISAVKNAPKDGSTILLTPIAPMSIFPHTYKSLDYDPVKDFTPITQIVRFDYGFAINKDIPAKNIEELIAWLKDNPNRANYGSPGVGALPQFTGILFGEKTGLSFNHIPYRGSIPAITDLIGGQISSVILPISDLIQFHRDGKLRLIAVSGTQRSALVPDVPTFRDAELDIVSNGWYGFYAPAGTPADEISRLNAAIIQVANSPDVKTRTLDFGFEAISGTPEELAALQKSDSDKWGPVIRKSGFVSE
ncbi:MAG TPA: Bug family tripartite tricarboxylate transporter substrate binding protein [Xanthobacteraceae bacterium]|nr:Bug family tripartite tricarboxylate transporter substrate binding protein [Xanthobacteraceae bacterium]